MIKSLLIVGIGSFMGGVMRYAISILMKSFCEQGFPWTTLMVNLLGCFIFGAVVALFGKYNLTNSMWCLMLTTGFCGGFTTFSAFANESLQLLQNGNLCLFIFYLMASIGVGLLFIALGYAIAK